jgi:hypothetical protein
MREASTAWTLDGQLAPLDQARCAFDAFERSVELFEQGVELISARISALAILVLSAGCFQRGDDRRSIAIEVARVQGADRDSSS